MKHKYSWILISSLLATLACNTLLPASVTPISFPPAVNSPETPYTTPGTVPTAMESPEASDAAPVPTSTDALGIPNATIEYYDVSGSTEWEIRDHLNAIAPVDENGYRGDGLTSWEIHWNWDGYGSETCDLSSATTSYKVVVRLPRWTPPPGASPELVTKWNDYMSALLEHEKGHVDNVVAYFPQVIEAIHGATCDTADARAQDVLSQLRSDDLEYDEETNHGSTQGAIFP